MQQFSLIVQTNMQASQRKLLDLAGDFKPILENASRLLDDAKIVRAKRRYPTAAALAVMSVEETGKFLLHHEAFEEIQTNNPIINVRGIGYHKKKQRIVAMLLVGRLSIEEAEDLHRIAGKEWKQIGDLSPDWRTKFIDVIASINFSTLSDERTCNMKTPLYYRFLVDMAAGRFDELKQFCFYADSANNGVWTDASTRVDRITADKVIKTAQAAMTETYRGLKHHEHKKKYW